MSYCVYKHTSPSEKVYIGITKQTPDGRWKKGLGYQSSPHFWSAIQKYGWDNIKHEIVFEGLSEEKACEKERELILKHNATDPLYGYNQKTGGELGSQLNEEARKKQSESCKRFYENNPDVCKRISEKNKGYRHTEEAKLKMSLAAKNRHCALTDEWKANIGKANKQRLLEDEDLYKSTVDRCRENGAKASKPVEQLDLDGNVIARFQNAHEAERKTGLRNANIGRCCRGISKSCGGYKWQYAS